MAQENQQPPLPENLAAQARKIAKAVAAQPAMSLDELRAQTPPTGSASLSRMLAKKPR
jgi:hypothetical protein